MNKIVCLTIIAVICFLSAPKIYTSSNLQDLNQPTLEILDDSVDNSDILEVFDADTSAMIKENTLFSTDNYATYYFKNLTENYGKNCVGSCSYVAIGMLLSYYDTYWDDSIIPDSFDQYVDIGDVRNIESISSPGITNDGELMKGQAELWGVSSLSNDQYFTVVQYNYNRYFHLNLINMGLNENIYKLYELFDRNPYGLGVYGRAALIDYYLYDYMGFDEDDISYEYVTTDIENYIKEKVSQGIPVLVAIGNSSNTGHAFIVYDYDENTGKLYGHLGWESTETHVDISTIYSSYYFKNALTLNINTPHSCSNNYVDSEGNKYCSCYFSCHPEHVCTYAICEDDDSKHVYTCNCQYKSDNTSDHSLVYVTQGVNSHVQRCRLCGWTSESEAHEWVVGKSDEYVQCRWCNHSKYIGDKFIPIIRSIKTEIQPTHAFADTE